MDKVTPIKQIFLKTFGENLLIKAFGAYLVIVVEFFFGVGKEQVLIALLMLVLADFITGVSASVREKHAIKSAKVYRTAIKLAIYFLAVSSGHFIEVALGYNIGADEMLIIFFGVTEFISILENMARLGFATPKKLLNIMEEVKELKESQKEEVKKNKKTNI